VTHPAKATSKSAVPVKVATTYLLVGFTMTSTTGSIFTS
jgi:hypothetical protein